MVELTVRFTEANARIPRLATAWATFLSALNGEENSTNSQENGPAPRQHGATTRAREAVVAYKKTGKTSFTITELTEKAGVKVTTATTMCYTMRSEGKLRVAGGSGPNRVFEIVA